MPLRAPARRSTLVLTLIALAIVATCLRLSWWQWQRAQSKERLYATQAARTRAPPLMLEAGFRYADDLRYRTGRVRGRFVAAGQVYIDNQVRDGRPGALVVTPLRLAGDTVSVLVVRGWVPWPIGHGRLPSVPVPMSAVEVDGVIDAPPPRASLLGDAPATAFDGDTWPWLDEAAMKRRAGAVAGGFVLRQGGADEGLLKRAPPLFEDKRGMHLGYALQWAVFALLAFIIYLRLLHGTRAARATGRGAVS